MLWTDVLAQERATETLARAIETGRVAHAYLFYGPDGVGKRVAALAFARALQCERGGAAPGTGACGECAGCLKAAKGLHPDVHVLMPYPSDTAPDEVGERLRLLVENPYAATDFLRRPSLADAEKTSNKQVHYSVERVHEDVRRPLSYQPSEGRRKVAILLDADLLRVEAANAFLKLLEEPAPAAVLILTTTRPDRVLPTILSRCQKVRFDVLPDEAVARALVERGGVAPADAPTLARMAGGSVSRGLELAGQGDLGARRELVVRFFRYAYARKAAEAGVVDEVAGLGREGIKNVLGLMLRWVHDLVRFRHGGEGAALVNVDQADSIGRFCRNVPHADLARMAALVEEALLLVERNAHAGLVARVLAARLGAAMHAGASPDLFVPLVETASA